MTKHEFSIWGIWSAYSNSNPHQIKQIWGKGFTGFKHAKWIQMARAIWGIIPLVQQPKPQSNESWLQPPNAYVKLARILLHMLQGSSISRFPLTKAADCISMVTPSGHNYPKPGQDGKTLQLWRASCHKPQRISGHINSRFRSAQSNSPLAQSAKKFQPLGYILRMDESNWFETSSTTPGSMTVLLEIARFHAQCSNSNQVKDQRHPHFHQNPWDETYYSRTGSLWHECRHARHRLVKFPITATY